MVSSTVELNYGSDGNDAKDINSPLLMGVSIHWTGILD